MYTVLARNISVLLYFTSRPTESRLHSDWIMKLRETVFPTGERQRQTDDALQYFAKTKAKCEAKRGKPKKGNKGGKSKKKRKNTIRDSASTRDINGNRAIDIFLNKYWITSFGKFRGSKVEIGSSVIN